MSSCQDELFERRDPPDYKVECVYCGLGAMRSTMRRISYRQYHCRDIDACKGRLRTEIGRAVGMPREPRPPTKLIGTLPANYDKVKPKVKINVSDPETKKIWDAAVAAKEEVDSWPDWKKGHLVREEVESDFKVDRCDACGAGNMQEMSGCKRLCRSCGFLRTCGDTV